MACELLQAVGQTHVVQILIEIVTKCELLQATRRAHIVHTLMKSKILCSCKLLGKLTLSKSLESKLCVRLQASMRTHVLQTLVEIPIPDVSCCRPRVRLTLSKLQLK